MTTQVYYRRWRPSSFAELVGQEHVANTLRQALKQDRVSHSYLFCGPRGSGKTTTARIVAKAANCLDLQDGDPCNACQVCLAVNDGRFLDIFELDAASNRGIDEIRDIRDKVNFSPAQGRRKVYIIDEAHMLTGAASNAFLKTLEEPPAHVIFILCTTQVHKIEPTIVSRCQRFDFRRLPLDLVCGRLQEIVDAEGVVVEPEALRMVARSAAGSLRDAQNLLEQLVVSYRDGVGLHQVEDLLGLGHGEQWLELTSYLLMGNTSASLGVINQAAWDGTDLRQFHRQALDLLRAAMLLRWGAREALDLPDHIVSQLEELVGKLPPWRIVKALKLWSQVNMRYDAPSTLPLELAAVEICEDLAAAAAGEEEQTGDTPPRAGSDAAASVAPRPATARPPPPAARTPRGQPPIAPSPPPQPAADPSAGLAPAEAAPQPAADLPAGPGPVSGAQGGSLASQWVATVKALGRHKGKKYNLGALLRDCKPEAISLEGDTLVLAFTNKSNMVRMQEEMDDPKGRRLVADAVEQFFDQPYEFRLTLVEDAGAGGNSSRSAQNSPLVRAAIGMGAKIIVEEAAE